ncbi:MAG: sulfite exporter TauE/SafE family protein [Acinetobacter populi]|jgi:uncharacterized membrane protein YfcA|uniref:sulfite exporter TauE/SafE family protein n=1 Tax=Acinetobacter populi TaxID=1582270 RepID=UPI002355B374|nr:sulfite exporter TauE/SafE family protein [Acinetobacter populi]MCH4246631.1 sulfite exporter TauE/SafE family protein [Acinetobacter populi]
MIYLALALTGILAGFISGIVGTGSSIILLPILAYLFGAKLAVPIMAIASIMGNISRVILWRSQLNIKAFLLFICLGMPMTILGANTLWIISPVVSDIIIGLFFICLIPIRYWAKAHHFQLNNMQLVLAGAVLGYLTGIVFSTGPLTLPIFSGFGLTKGALLATEAAASFTIYLTKAFTFGLLGALNGQTFIIGIMVGLTLMLGNYIGKYYVLQMSEQCYHLLLDLMLLIAGLAMWYSAYTVL